MSSSFYNTYRYEGSALAVADLVFQNLFVVAPGPAVFQKLIPNSGQTPDVNTSPGSSAGYLVLRSLTVTRRKDRRRYVGVREAVAQVYAVTIPNGGGAQIFQLSAAGEGLLSLTSIALEGWSVSAATVGVNTLALDRNDGAFVTVGIGPNILSSANGTLFSLTPVFGPYGFESLAPSSGGLRASIGFFNTSGGSVTVTLVLTGTKWEADLLEYDVLFTPTIGVQQTLLSRARLEGDPYTFPINLAVPAPLTDPGNPVYGQIGLAATTDHLFYDVAETLSTNLLASLYYQLPGGI